MERRVQHTAYLDLPFSVVCQRLEESGQQVLARATEGASSHADKLVMHLDRDLSFFHLDETVTITASPLERYSSEMAGIDLKWHADPRRRLLPNLDTKLMVHALIQSGPSATTALSIVGTFAPPGNLFRRLDEALFTRRLLDAVVHSFVNSVAEILSDVQADGQGEDRADGISRPSR